MKYKTTDLTGALLDAAVAKADAPRLDAAIPVILGGNPFNYSPSADWAQGGHIIERERIGVLPMTNSGDWHAGYEPLTENEFDWGGASACGPTPLIAAMRAFVAHKLGDEVEL